MDGAESARYRRSSTIVSRTLRNKYKPQVKMAFESLPSTASARFAIITAAAVAVVSSFSLPAHRPHRAAAGRATAPRAPCAPLSMAGMGMATRPKNKKKKKKGGSKGKGGAGSDRYDVAKAMIKSEKRYDELLSDAAKALNADDRDEGATDVTSEYVVAARASPGATVAKKEAGAALASASDWIPVAQLCVVRPAASSEGEGVDGLPSSVAAAVSLHRREILYAGTLAAPVLNSLPRNVVEYGIEPVDSFHKYVHEVVIEGKAVDSFDGGDGEGKVGMTKSKAREILELEAGCTDASAIKRAYRTQSMASHPDRFAGSDRTKEEVDEASRRFATVKMAYEALSSGVRHNGEAGGNGVAPRSWYESLGGRSRTEFAGPIELLPSERAGALGDEGFKSAVVGLDPELTMSFVARNQDAAR